MTDKTTHHPRSHGSRAKTAKGIHLRTLVCCLLFVVCCLVTNVSIESVTTACRFHCWHRCVSGAFLPETCRSLSHGSLKQNTRSSLHLCISTAIVLWCTRNPPRTILHPKHPSHIHSHRSSKTQGGNGTCGAHAEGLAGTRQRLACI